MVAGLVLLARGVDVRRLLQALARADSLSVGAAVGLNLFANTYARVRRRLALVTPLPRGSPPTLSEMTALFALGMGGNSLLPARAGDGLYVARLTRAHGYPLGAVVASQMAERLSEAWTLWVVAVALTVTAHLAGPFTLPIEGFALAGIPATALLVWHCRRDRAEPSTEPLPAGLYPSIKRRFASLSEPLRRLHAPAVWMQAVGWSCLSDLVDALMVGICLSAVGITLVPSAWFMVLLAINLAIAVPSTPGQAGVLEGAAVVTVEAFGAGRDKALAFALLYHAAHAVPMVLLALATLPSLRRGATDVAGPR